MPADVAAAAAACVPWARPAPDWFVYGVVLVMLFGLAVALGAIRRQLAAPGSGWSLADALSEVANLSVLDGAGVPVRGDAGPVTRTVLVASTSRLIALVGMLAIAALFIGFGMFILWGFGTTGCVPASTGTALQFLLGGLTLFAPYAINKVAASISGR